MATTTIRPNADNSGVGTFAKVGGAASKVAGLADDVNTTGIKKDGTLTGTQRCSFTYPNTVSLSATQRVRQVRLRIKATTPNSTGKFDAQLGALVSGTTSYATPISVRGTYLTETTFTGAWYPSAPDGAEWTQSRLDGLVSQFSEYREDTFQATLTEAYIDIDVANEPTVAVVTPASASTITATSSPSFSWTYTDSDSDQQSYYHIKVFSSAEYGAGGFNATTSVATYDSGENASADATTGISDGTLLVNGVYRAYIRAGKIIAGRILYSDWAYNQFTQDVVPPTVPTLTATVDSTLNLVTLSAVGASVVSIGLTSQYFIIMRSDDQAVTWVDVRGATELAPDGSFIVAITDYEAPRGISVLYRVNSIGVSGENLLVSAWSANADETIVNDNSWWFKSTSTPAFNLGAIKVANGTQEGFVESVSVFRPLGRTTPVVVGGYTYGNDGQYTITTITDAEFNSIELLLRHQGKLLVQDPYGTQKYIRLLSRSWQAGGTSGRRMRRVNIDYVEIEAF